MDNTASKAAGNTKDSILFPNTAPEPSSVVKENITLNPETMPYYGKFISDGNALPVPASIGVPLPKPIMSYPHPHPVPPPIRLALLPTQSGHGSHYTYKYFGSGAPSSAYISDRATDFSGTPLAVPLGRLDLSVPYTPDPISIGAMPPPSAYDSNGDLNLTIPPPRKSWASMATAASNPYIFVNQLNSCTPGGFPPSAYDSNGRLNFTGAPTLGSWAGMAAATDNPYITANQLSSYNPRSFPPSAHDSNRGGLYFTGAPTPPRWASMATAANDPYTSTNQVSSYDPVTCAKLSAQLKQEAKELDTREQALVKRELAVYHKEKELNKLGSTAGKKTTTALPPNKYFIGGKGGMEGADPSLVKYFDQLYRNPQPRSRKSAGNNDEKTKTTHISTQRTKNGSTLTLSRVETEPKTEDLGEKKGVLHKVGDKGASEEMKRAAAADVGKAKVDCKQAPTRLRGHK
ncbi:hypothetical protein LTR36_004843 [Oleoguttula mirabilis]|uniref:Uncharacterized protein n=1 Tax=Oleoguttula mirabilis TaxID=1507867 RepID=A0AAV9JF01_9PEZI|nr:hypothetical protein LTR36_004843 [Oleoguttula mirabilis]